MINEKLIRKQMPSYEHAVHAVHIARWVTSNQNWYATNENGVWEVVEGSN
jgi:hypothetical protein